MINKAIHSLLNKFRNDFTSQEWLYYQYVSYEDPIVIGGCARSGTTLISAILGANSKLFCGDEFPLLSKSVFSLKLLLEKCSYFGYSLRELQGLCSRANCHVRLLEIMMQDFKVKHGLLGFVTKSPFYTFDLPAIFSDFPNSRFIFMCRDGRDVALSLRKHRYSINIPSDAPVDQEGLLELSYCADIWRKFINLYRPWQRDGRCKLLKYEDLVLNPEQTLKDLCEFIDIPFETQMLEFYRSPGLLSRKDLNMPHLREIRSKISPDRVSSWKQSLNKTQVESFEKRAFRELSYLGYELATLSTPSQAPI